MLDILRITGVFVLIIYLLRRKMQVGYVMLLAAAVLAMLYAMSPAKTGTTVLDAMMSPVTVKLLIALTAIRVFELILREKGVFTQMMESSRKVIRNRKMLIISMPLLIGMLPSVGGAYFSAPMVEESTSGLDMPPEEKSFVNYWYRHPWEYVLPLYPGILLASAVSGLKLRTLIYANVPYALTILAIGLLLSMRGLKDIKPSGGRMSLKDVLSFAPIAGVFALVAVFSVPLHYALLGSVVLLFALFRFSPRDIFRALKYGLSPQIVVLIGGVMIFKEVMEASGAVNSLSAYFTDMGIPLMPMLILVPFITGLLTGLAVGFVGAAFPLLVSLAGGAHLADVSLAFAAGFVGVLLSPVHVCLILTREYFKAEMWGIYRRLMPASVAVVAVAVAEYLLLR